MKDSFFKTIPIEDEWTTRFWRELPQKALIFTFFLAVFFDVYGGFIRYTLSSIGLTSLIYLPKIAMAIVLFFGVIGWMQRSIVHLNYIVLLAAGSCLLAFAVGALNGLPFTQMIFGSSIFMPLLFGIQLGLIARSWLKARLLWIAFLSAVLGILINFVVGDMPWTGSSYSVGDVVVEANREWTHAEFSRLSGFSRISAQAAIQIAGLGLMVYAYAVNRRRGLWLGSAVLIVALVAVLLTTTKSALAALFIVLLILPIRRFPFFNVFISLLFVIMVGLPLAAYSYSLSLDYSNPISQILLSSFDERLIYTWPITFGLIERYGTWGFGLGLGGVGTPSKTLGGIEQGDALVGDLGLSYTDNLALYLYGNLGFSGILILIALTIATFRLCRSHQLAERAIGLASVCLLVCGLTIDMMEMLFAPIVFGLCLGMAFKSSGAPESAATYRRC